MTKHPPKGLGLARAAKKLRRLNSNGARTRAVKRQSKLVDRLRSDFNKRMAAWKEAQK